MFDNNDEAFRHLISSVKKPQVKMSKAYEKGLRENMVILSRFTMKYKLMSRLSELVQLFMVFFFINVGPFRDVK